MIDFDIDEDSGSSSRAEWICFGIVAVCFAGGLLAYALSR